MALLKRNAMAAPFEHAFDEFHKLQEEASKFTSEEAPQGVREGGQVMAIHYRDEEAIYIKASHDRVTVIFSTIFREETDRVFGKVFIQEFVDARRRAIQNAPQVLFRTDPPLELQGVPGVQNSGNGEIGYVTFGWLLYLSFKVDLTVTVLFPRHLSKQRRDEVISHIQTFRDYFHYHIKASKVCYLPIPALLVSMLIIIGIHSLQNAQAYSRLPSSTSESTSRKRRKGTKDCKRTDIQARKLRS